MEALVVDASLVVDALCRDTDVGDFARELLSQHQLFSPDHIYIESAHAIKNLSRVFDGTRIELMRHGLTDLPMTQIGFKEFGDIAWRHRHHLSIYDAGYLAVSLLTGFPLATSDKRLAEVAQEFCEVIAA